MTRQKANDVANLMKVRGFDVTPDEVLAFARDEYLPPSVVGDEYDQARDDALVDLLASDSHRSGVT